MTVRLFHEELDLADHCRAYMSARRPTLAYEYFEAPVHLILNGADFLVVGEVALRAPLVYVAANLAWCVLRTLARGSYELDFDEFGVLPLRLSFSEGSIRVTRDDLGIEETVAAHDFLAATLEFGASTAAELLAVCPQLVNDESWGPWFKGDILLGGRRLTDADDSPR